MSTMSAQPPISETNWQDGKRWWWLLSPALPAIGLASIVAVIAGAPSAWLWSLPIILYVLAPALDWLIGEDPINAPESAVEALDKDKYYLAIVYAYIPSQYLTTILASWLAVTGDLSGMALAALMITTGVANGIAINTAHELGHKTDALARWMAKVTLAPVAYGHFFIEHNKGHHKNVATPEDPASSRMGESFWAFLPRTVFGSLKSAWSIERRRLQRQGHAVWSWRNENLQAWAMTVVLFTAISIWLGPMALAFLVAQAVFGFSLLEVVNYLEHYGLLRQKLANGRYERCQPEHSWNSNHVVTNLFLYQLQRHSDHHANPTRRYQALRHFENSPQLPSGYAAMILLAYVPPLWFRVMNPRVVAHYQGDLSKAHLAPSKREKLLAQYGLAPLTRPVASPVSSAPAAACDDCSAMQCPNCHYVYEQARGCPAEGYAAGTAWRDLPDDFQCPDCAVRDKPDFTPLADNDTTNAKAAA